MNSNSIDAKAELQFGLTSAGVTLYRLRHVWNRITLPLRRFNTALLLTLLYILILLPLAGVLRALRRSEIQCDWDPQALSYRIVRHTPVARQQLERTF